MEASSTAISKVMPERLFRILAPTLVGLLTLTVHALSPVTTSTDSAWTFHLAASVLQQHNFDLDEYRNLVDPNGDYRLREYGGHIYSYYPIATPLLVAPAVSLINALYPLSHPTDFYTYLASHAPDERTARLEELLASGFVSLAAALMYVLARQRLDLVRSTAVALIFSFSTSMWSTASRALWQHGPSALFLLLALYVTLSAKDSPARLLLVGFLLGFAYLIRPTNSISVLFFGLYVLLNRRRQVLFYAGGVLLALGPYMWLNFNLYGNPLPPYSYQLFERLGTPAQIGAALAGTLISPGRGLFVFTPVFLFSIYGAVVAAREGPHFLERIEPYLIGIILAHWITTSLFQDWGGAWSIGPRYFVDVIPFLTYLLIPLFLNGALARPALKLAFLAAVLVSAGIQARCAISPYPFIWNGKPQALVDAPGRLWDWGDLQFLRGLCGDDPIEGRAPACWFGSRG